MSKSNLKNPWIVILIVLLVLLGLGGVGGGITLLINPSGAGMGLPPGLLDQLYIDDFFLPGLFLIFGMGFVPLMIAFAVWKQTHWSWVGAFLQGVVLILWIDVQIFLWGSPIALQYIYLGGGSACLY